ncbi:hypothetical protein DYY65_04615 [Nitrososphaera sp. AFS]|nr:hypothetical protein [Nitrososphaera sp. AFS]
MAYPTIAVPNRKPPPVENTRLLQTIYWPSAFRILTADSFGSLYALFSLNHLQIWLGRLALVVLS